MREVVERDPRAAIVPRHVHDVGVALDVLTQRRVVHALLQATQKWLMCYMHTTPHTISKQFLMLTALTTL